MGAGPVTNFIGQMTNSRRRGGWRESARCFILSPSLQCAVQFTVAVLITGLFIYIRPLVFPLSCLSAVMLAVALAVLSTDNHIGTRLQASANMMGGTAWGAVLGGIVLTLSYLAAPSSCLSYVGCPQHTAALCCLSVAALGLLVANRAALGAVYPPLVWLAGLMSVMGYGIVLIAGQFITDLRRLWMDVVGAFILTSAIGTGLTGLVSLLVLPSLAVDELRADTAAAIRAIGYAASRAASRVLKPDVQQTATATPANPAMPGAPLSAGVGATLAHQPVVPPTGVLGEGRGSREGPDMGAVASSELGAGSGGGIAPGAEPQPGLQLPSHAPLHPLKLHPVRQSYSDLETIREGQPQGQQQPQQLLAGRPPSPRPGGRLEWGAAAGAPVFATARGVAPLPRLSSLLMPHAHAHGHGHGQGPVRVPPNALPQRDADAAVAIGHQDVNTVQRPASSKSDQQVDTSRSFRHSSNTPINHGRFQPLPTPFGQTPTPTHFNVVDWEAGCGPYGRSSTGPGFAQGDDTAVTAAANADADAPPMPHRTAMHRSHRIPGVGSCPTLDQMATLAGAGPGNGAVDVELGGVSRPPSTSGYSFAPSSVYSSDEEPSRYPPDASNHVNGDGAGGGDPVAFEDLMEDEDAFLMMLQQATAPQDLPVPKAPSRRSKRASGGGASSGAATGKQPEGRTDTSFTRSSSHHHHHHHHHGAADPRRPPPPVAPPGGILPSPFSADLLRLASAASSRVMGLMDKKSLVAESVAPPEGPVPGAGPATAYGGGGVSASTVAWAPVSAIRPLLARAKACAAAAGLEPSWLMCGPADPGAWSRVLAGCEALLSRVAALEGLIEDQQAHGQGGNLLSESGLADMLGCNILAPYRQVYGEVAASCAAMSLAIADSCKGYRNVDGDKVFPAVGGWEETKQRLRAVVRGALASYWARVRARVRGGSGSGNRGAAEQQQSRPHPLHPNPHLPLPPGLVAPLAPGAPQLPGPGAPTHRRLRRGGRGGRIRILGLHQSRAINFLWTVTESIISAMDELEAAVRQALVRQKEREQPPKAAGAAGAGTSVPPGLLPAGPGPRSCIRDTQQPSPRGGSAGGASPGSGCDAGRTDSTDSRRGGNGRGDGTPDGIASGTAAPLGLEGRAMAPASSGPEVDAAGLGPGAVGGPSGSDGSFSGPVPVGGSGMVVIVVQKDADATLQALETTAGAVPGPGETQGQPQQLGTRLRQVTRLAGEVWEAQCKEWDWAVRLTKFTLGLPMLENIPVVTLANIRLLLTGGAAGRTALLSSRNTQFGLKYWLATSVVLCIILGLCARTDTAIMRQYSMLYAYLATSVSMTDRVESTLSRAALRAGGTVLGGAVGLAVLMSPGLHSSPVGIMALVCAVTFLTGCLSGHRLLYGAALTMITFNSMVMCQWSTCSGDPVDVAKLFVARVVSVLLGCTLPVLFTQAILPWFTSDWALETMARAFLAAGMLVRQLYGQYFDEHLKAHVAEQGVGPTLEVLRLHGLEREAEELERQQQLQQQQQQEEEEEEERKEGAASQQQAEGQVLQGPAMRQQQQGQQQQQVATNPIPQDQKQRQDKTKGVDQRDGEPQPRLGRHCGGVEAEGEAGKDVSGHRRDADAGAGGGRGSGAAGDRELGALSMTAVRAVSAAAEVIEAAAGAVGAAATAVGAAVVRMVAREERPQAVTMQAHVSGPLVAVQTSLMKDVAVWTRGIYATPVIVPAVLRCCLLLADRLAALQLVVADTPPPVSGRLSGWVFAMLVAPLHCQTVAMLDALDVMTSATARLLTPATATIPATRPQPSAPPPPAGNGVQGMVGGKQAEASGGKAGAEAKLPSSSPEEGTALAELQEAIHDLELRRLQMRQRIHDIRVAFHASVRSVDEHHVPYDTVRFHAMFHSLVKVLDKATATARTVVELRSRRDGEARRGQGPLAGWSQKRGPER